MPLGDHPRTLLVLARKPLYTGVRITQQSVI
jgi:hypothetical protein